MENYQPKQQGLFNSPAMIKSRAKKLLADLDHETAAKVLSRLVLDEIRVLIDKFPLQLQQEIVALLTDGYLEKWNKEKAEA